MPKVEACQQQAEEEDEIPVYGFRSQLVLWHSTTIHQCFKPGCLTSGSTPQTVRH